MGPLDMRGLVEASTIIGCLKYGACFSGLDDQDNPVFLVRLKDEDLVEAPDDLAFLQSLRFSCARVAEQSFWCIDAWKGDWVRMDKMFFLWLRWESSTCLMPFALSHKGPGEQQPHAKLWTFPLAMFQKIPILSRGMRTSSFTPRRIPVERKTPAAKRDVDQDMVAKEESVSDAESECQGCQTTPPQTLNVLM